MIRTYSELRRLNTFEERFEYCKCSGTVGDLKFGSLRYFNQKFYTSPEWKRIRNEIIRRDNGCDLGINDGNHLINGKIVIHHLVPLTIEDLENITEFLLDPEYMISVSDLTHKAIHYSNADILPKGITERKINDTIPWRL